MTDISYEEFAEQHGLTLAWSATDSNPDMVDQNWEADHYIVTISGGTGLPTSLYFSKGKGHHGVAPMIEEVLENLAMNARGIKNADGFKEWAEELGFNSDSIRELEIYEASVRITNDLERTIGETAMEQLLWHTTDAYSIAQDHGDDDEEEQDADVSPKV
jgi:hypothetical protein